MQNEDPKQPPVQNNELYIIEANKLQTVVNYLAEKPAKETFGLINLLLTLPKMKSEKESLENEQGK